MDGALCATDATSCAWRSGGRCRWWLQATSVDWRLSGVRRMGPVMVLFSVPSAPGCVSTRRSAPRSAIARHSRQLNASTDQMVAGAGWASTSAAEAAISGGRELGQMAHAGYHPIDRKRSPDPHGRSSSRKCMCHHRPSPYGRSCSRSARPAAVTWVVAARLARACRSARVSERRSAWAGAWALDAAGDLGCALANEGFEFGGGVCV
jgi:hypothetical protein